MARNNVYQTCLIHTVLTSSNSFIATSASKPERLLSTGTSADSEPLSSHSESSSSDLDLSSSSSSSDESSSSLSFACNIK